MLTDLLPFDEREERLNVGRDLVVRPQNLAGVAQADLRAVQQPMGGRDELDPLGRKIVSLERDDVNAARTSRNALDQHERRHVVQGAAQSAHERVAADRDELVNRGAAADRRVVVHVDVTGQQRAVGDNDVAAELAVVGDVAVAHQEVVVADEGDAVFLLARAVDGHPFAERVVVADDD